MTSCPNCGAPLPPVAPGESERCTFCGIVERAPVAPAPAPAPAWPLTTSDDEFVPPPRSAAPVIALLSAALAVVALVVVVLLIDRHPTQTQQSAPPGAPTSTLASPVTPSPKPTATAPSILTLATLATLSGSSGVLLDAPGMVGPLSSFDVVANYDWIAKIGTAWKSDALLVRLEVTQAARDGTVNVGTGAHGYVVSYQFDAPSCRCDLYVDLEGAGDTPNVKVRTMGGGSANEAAIQKPICTLPKAFAALAKAGMPHLTPTYSAVMLTNTHTVWVVSFFASMSPTRGGEGVVNAATCAVESMR